MNKEKEVKELLNKCDNCKLKECIGCEFTCTEIQKIKEYVEQKETILDKVTDKLKRLNKKYTNEYNNLTENMELSATKVCVLQELNCIIEDLEDTLNIIEGEKK